MRSRDQDKAGSAEEEGAEMVVPEAHGTFSSTLDSYMKSLGKSELAAVSLLSFLCAICS